MHSSSHCSQWIIFLGPWWRQVQCLSFKEVVPVRFLLVPKFSASSSADCDQQCKDCWTLSPFGQECRVNNVKGFLIPNMLDHHVHPLTLLFGRTMVQLSICYHGFCSRYTFSSILNLDVVFVVFCHGPAERPSPAANPQRWPWTPAMVCFGPPPVWKMCAATRQHPWHTGTRAHSYTTSNLMDLFKRTSAGNHGAHPHDHDQVWDIRNWCFKHLHHVEGSDTINKRSLEVVLLVFNHTKRTCTKKNVVSYNTYLADSLSKRVLECLKVLLRSHEPCKSLAVLQNLQVTPSNMFVFLGAKLQAQSHIRGYIYIYIFI